MPGQIGIDQQAALGARDDRRRGTPRTIAKSSTVSPSSSSTVRIAVADLAVIVHDDEDHSARPVRRRRARRGARTCAADARRGSRRWMAAPASSSFTGLLSCTQFCCATSRSVAVDMSPVRMMAGNLPLQLLAHLATRSAAVHAVAADCSRPGSGRAGRLSRVTRSSAAGRPAPSPGDDPRPSAASPAARAPRDRPRRPGWRRSDASVAGAVRAPAASASQRPKRGPVRASVTSMANTDPLPGASGRVTRWPSRSRQPLHDGQAETQPAAAFARRVVELVVLLEDRLKLLVGNADAGIPDLDAQRARAPAAAEQHLAVPACISARSTAGCECICSSSRGSLRIVRPQGTTRRASPCACA